MPFGQPVFIVWLKACFLNLQCMIEKTCSLFYKPWVIGPKGFIVRKLLALHMLIFFYKSLHYHEPLVLMHANKAQKASIHQFII